MICPNCGQPSTTEQQFCRQCGMNLLPVGQLVSQHSATPAEKQSKVHKAFCEREMARGMFSWIWWGMVIMGIGVLMLVFAKNLVAFKIYDPELAALLRMLSTLVILGGTGSAMFGVLNSMRKGVALSGARRPAELSEQVNTKELPTSPMPLSLPSVTERTTQLISPETVSRTDELLKN
jgi:hypothetical protein